jgi:hypothetical protein
MLRALVAMLPALHGAVEVSVVERLAAAAAPIAVVRVIDVGDLTPEGPRVAANATPLRIAEVSVERRVLGDPTRATFSLVLRAEEERTGASIQIGSRALVLVDYDARDDWVRGDTPTRRRLERIESPRGPASPFAVGVWPIRGDGADARVEVPQNARPLPIEIAADGRATDVALSALLDWLDRAVARSTPSLRADEISTGPAAWSITLASDGTWSGSTSGRLQLTEIANLWATLEAERFRELPPRVGKSGGPDSGFLLIRVRTLDGIQTVTIEPCEPTRLVDAERENLERALRVWRALPGHVAR